MRRPYHALRLSILSLLLMLAQSDQSDGEKNRTDRAAEVKAEHRQYIGPPPVHLQPPPPPPPPLGPPGPPPYGPPPPPPELSDPWPVSRPDMPLIKNINVLCEKNRMRVSIEFDRPFFGMIFSKGHYSDDKCVHLPPNTGRMASNFEIYLNACGMTSSGQTSVAPGGPGYADPAGGVFIENTIIVQYDPLVQEVWDQARKLRCTWYDYYEKSVTFRPFNVDMLQAVTANFLGDNLQCWMQIQVGKGPWASEVSGIVKIGQAMTMVLAIKDDENRFDMLVRNCIAHDGKRPPIQLVDEYGCVVRPKIMSRFQKIKNFGSSASVVSYAYFQAFKFPDSMNVHFQCVIQVCRHQCPDPRCPGDVPALPPPGYLDPRIPIDKSDSDIGETNIAKKSASSSSSGGQAYVVGGDSNTRTGDLKAASSNSVPYTVYGGQPRAMRKNGINSTSTSEDSKSRRRRAAAASAEEEVDVSTSRLIQVVAPDDVSFNLSVGSDPSLVVFKSEDFDLNQESFCMSMTKAILWAMVFSVILFLSLAISVFLYYKNRTLQKKDSCTYVHHAYDNPEFVKTPHH